MKPVSIEDYFKRSGDDSLMRGEVEQDETGFIIFRVDGDILNGLNIYGDGDKWRDRLIEIAKERGCNKIRCCTRRNPEAFSKKFGMEIIGYIMEKEV